MTRRGPHRAEPYDLAAVDPEAWRRYWIGKAPRVRAAVKEYLSKYATPEQVTYPMLQAKYGISQQSLMVHIRRLADEGLIPGLYIHINREAMARKKAVPPEEAPP